MKTTIGNLKKRRAARESSFLVTGGTGFIGSHIAVALMEKGYQVILLVRPGQKISGEDRIGNLMDWFATPSSSRYRPEVVEGFLDRPSLGLSPHDFEKLALKVNEIVHCGADTSFKQERDSVNIIGLQHLSDLANKGRCDYFHHISTAYVAGKGEGICTETLEAPAAFHNSYEETKYQGEVFATETFPPSGIRLNIYRPSIVYGDSRSGKTFRFNALYFPIKMALFLKKVYETDIHENGGKKAAQMGVKIDKNGKLFLPIRMVQVEQGGLNLIPVDYLCNAFIALMEECLTGDIFHMVGKTRQKLDQLINYGKKMFHFDGIRPVSQQEYEESPATGPEILFQNYLELYKPYLNDLRIFDSRKAGIILDRRGITCPEFNYKRFALIMNYAIEADWGKKNSPK